MRKTLHPDARPFKPTSHRDERAPDPTLHCDACGIDYASRDGECPCCQEDAKREATAKARAAERAGEPKP